MRCCMRVVISSFFCDGIFDTCGISFLTKFLEVISMKFAFIEAITWPTLSKTYCDRLYRDVL